MHVISSKAWQVVEFIIENETSKRGEFSSELF